MESCWSSAPEQQPGNTLTTMLHIYVYLQAATSCSRSDMSQHIITHMHREYLGTYLLNPLLTEERI